MSSSSRSSSWIGPPRARRDRRSTTASGFTLIELLVVISIIIIVSAASIPAGLNYVRVYKITGAGQNVAAQIQQARSQAVKRNTARGILLVFNYPQADRYQFTSLDPDPWTGAWDGGVYPANPGVFDPNTTVAYGSVPAPPDNRVDPNPAQGIQSPHGIPVLLPVDVFFEPGERNALLFRADGSVAAVNASGPIGQAAVSRAPNGVDWMISVEDRVTNLRRTIHVTPNGRVRVEAGP